MSYVDPPAGYPRDTAYHPITAAEQLVVEAGIVVAKIHSVRNSGGLPDGHVVVSADDYAESVVGSPLAWPRAKRDALLAACDWTLMPDAPLTADQVTASKAYRTALRNLPATSPEAASVVWPALPTWIASVQSAV